MNNAWRLFQAEWQKTVGNAQVITFLVWVYPIVTLLIVLLSTGISLFMYEPARDHLLANPPLWTKRLLEVWNTFNEFPFNMFIRMPLMALAAVIFAGEYQWDTLKNIITRRRRMAIILTKFVILGLLIIITLSSTSLIWWAGGWLQAFSFDVPYGPESGDEMVANFSRIYLSITMLTFVSTILIATYAALFAIVSRSILASLLSSLGLGIIEAGSPAALLLMGQMLDKPNVVNLYAITPIYNLANIYSWINDGISSNASGLWGFTSILGLQESILIVGLWMVVLIGLTIWLFQRQDITS